MILTLPKYVVLAVTIGLLLGAGRFVAAEERGNTRQSNTGDTASRPSRSSAVPTADAPTRASRRPQPAGAQSTPAAVGRVSAYDAERSVTVEIRRRGGIMEPIEFRIVPEQTKIELPGDVKSIAVDLQVTVWADANDPKTAIRIVVAGAPQPGGRRPSNNRPNAPGAGMMNGPPTQLARVEQAAPVAPVFTKRDPVAGLAPRDVAREIDRQIDAELAKAGVQASPRSDDAEFLRRVYLDIAGIIPPADVAASFLDRNDTDKRAALIDELLESPVYGEHFGDLWCDRVAVKDMPIFREPFIAWMAACLNSGRGWDETVFDMLTAGGSFNFIARGKRLACTEPQALFLLLNTEEGIDKGPNPAGLTAEGGRLFLGVQLQCAECHDHPFTQSWKQTDFWGLAAFYGGLKHQSGQGSTQWIETQAASGMPANITIPPTALKSVGTVVPARLLGESRDFVSADATPLRQTLARWMTSPENPYFAQAAANRLWADFFGRGLVNPIDDLRPDNPPTHPDVLNLLAGELKKSRFDLKHLIRCICLSEAYQRTSAPTPENADDASLYSHMAVKILGPGVFYDCLKQATGWPAMQVGIPERKTKLTVLTQFTPREVFVDFFRSTQGQEPDPQEYLHGIPQALKLMNAAQLNRVSPIVERLSSAIQNREQVIEQLYLAALARRPTADEMTTMNGFLASRADAAEGYSAILWALVNSAEFVSNH